MVIGIDASRANRAQKTGVEWYCYHLIQELKKIPLKSGDKFILYSPAELRGGLEDLPGGWEARILFWPPKYLWTQIRLNWEVFIKPPDILFIPTHSLPIFCRAKSVVTIHDLGFERFKKAYSFWQRIYYPFVHRFAVKYADKIIVPSLFTKKELAQLYKADPNKIVVIPPGYDSRNYKVTQDREKIEEVLAKYKIKKPYFLYVGRLEKKKNIKGLVEAYGQFLSLRGISRRETIFKQIPNLVLVGSPGFGYRKIKNQISKIKNIREIGYVKLGDLVYLYNAAEAFIFPSFYEGFGIPILEAMASNCPVVAANTASIPEVAGDAALYFNPENLLEMAGTIKKIIDNKGLINELIEKGQVRVKKFSWEKCAQKTLRVLLNC